MHDQSVRKIAKWPFLLGDLLLLGAAGMIYSRASGQLTFLEGVLLVLCAALGAMFAVLPFMLEYRAVMKVVEAGALTDVVAQISQMELIAGQITGATSRWQVAQEAADKTALAAREIADRMTGELKEFSEFMRRNNDSEKANLRLEVEKLRRGEGEWLQVTVRMLDHVHALHQGAVRSGQANLVQQLSMFQHACREVARRVGLEPFVPAAEEGFDPERHQVMEGELMDSGAAPLETIATGYTFQGRLLRRALVKLSSPVTAPASVGASSAP